MNFSIILTVFNAENDFNNCLDSILLQKYPLDKFEVIIINDGSSDNTLSILKDYKNIFRDAKIQYKYVNLTQNVGRIKARLAGAKLAKYKKIIICDALTKLDNNFLQIASGYDSHFNLITNIYMDEKYGRYNLLLKQIRKRYYRSGWGENLNHDISITAKNFDNIAKGTGGFITTKNQFTKYSNELIKMNSINEDTGLFKIYLKNNQKLLKSYKLRALYINRSGIEELKHLFDRGPRFADYYLKKKEGIFLIASLFICLSLILFFIKTPLITITTTIIIDIIIGLYFTDKLKNIIIFMFYIPVIGLTFWLGILNGIINKKSFHK